MTMTTTTNATAPAQDAPLPVDLLDLLWQDVLALFLINDVSLLKLTLTTAGRGRPDDVPLSLLSYDY
jgi:hypothetical protein